MCLARIDLSDEAVIYLDIPCVRILVQFVNKDTVDELMDDFISKRYTKNRYGRVAMHPKS